MGTVNANVPRPDIITVAVPTLIEKKPAAGLVTFDVSPINVKVTIALVKGVPPIVPVTAESDAV
jgi:hypothetical protein